MKRPSRLSVTALLSLAISLGAIMLSPGPASAGPSRYVFEMCDSVLPGGGVDGVVYGPHPLGLFSSENTCGQPGGALVLRQNEIGAGGGGAASWAIPISPSPWRHARVGDDQRRRLRGDRTLALVTRLDQPFDELAEP